MSTYELALTVIVAVALSFMAGWYTHDRLTRTDYDIIEPYFDSSGNIAGFTKKKRR